MIWRWLWRPSVHFLGLGGLLFVGVQMLQVGQDSGREHFRREPIVITVGQIRELQADFFKQYRVNPTQLQLQELIKRAVTADVLYREARFQGLDVDDPSVRQRLIKKMRVISDRPSQSDTQLYRQALALGLENDIVIRSLLIQNLRRQLEWAPSESQLTEVELTDYFERERNRFLQPARVSFAHVFIRRGGDKEELEERARAVLARLQSQAPASPGAIEMSDPFGPGRQFSAYTKDQITALFGEVFAKQVLTLPAGRWSGPLLSDHGLHLVWVSDRWPAAMPPLHTVQQKLAAGVLKERAEKRFAQGVTRLRRLYDVRIEGVDDASARHRLKARRP